MNYLDQIFQQKTKLLEMGKTPTKVKISKYIFHALRDEYLKNGFVQKFNPEAKLLTIGDLKVEFHPFDQITVE